MRKSIAVVFMCLVGSVFCFGNVVQAGIDDGLVAYYPFDGDANDESGNGNHSTVNSAVLTTDRNGNQNNAYYFNGAGNYIVAENLDVRINDIAAFTVAGWFKTNLQQNGPLYGCGEMIANRRVLTMLNLQSDGVVIYFQRDFMVPKGINMLIIRVASQMIRGILWLKSLMDQEVLFV